MKHNGIKSALIICIFMSSLLFANAQRHSNPLIIPIWHQTDPWNARCPGVGQTRAHAGSHALAMAKTMKYWSYPNQGLGNVYYTDDDFGAIMVSFTPEINWGGMSNTLVFQTTQRFIYTCGAAALTDYEYEYSTSSLTNVRNALINNFRYDDSMQILQRSAFSNFEWKDLIRMELDNLRVVIYTATLASGREIAFIVDAYNDEGLFHINFSDVNNQEMWVELNDLTVMGEAIPNSGQQMLTGIQPSLGPDTITENFESGFGHHNWQFSGNTQWTISSESFYYGSHSAKSGNIDHNQSSSLFLVMDVFENDSISFYKRVSCEAQTEHLYDHLAFFIDGVEMQRWSGDGTWESHTYPVTAGLHEFRWTYFKDGASVYFSDCAWVDAISLPEGTTPLNAPLNLQAQVVDGNDVSLHWAAPQPVNPGLTGYRIFRNEAEIAQLLNPSLVNFTDANLPNGDYTYYLKALYSAGASNPGNSVEVNVQVPYPPQNLTANVIGLDSVELNWQVPPIILNRSLMGYYVYRNGTVVAQIENPGATTYLDADLAEGAYYYHVSALYNVGESPLSNGAMAALGVPEPPSGLQAVVSGNNVSLSWNQVQVPQALTGFKVLRNGAVIAQIDDTQQLSYLDQGLRNGNYSYAVRALYGDTESASSAAVNVSIELIYAPVNLSTEVIGNDVHLVWEMPDMVRALSHYFVYRNGNLIAGVFNPSATQYSDYDLPNGIYEYRISAWYSGVESPRSEPAQAEVEILYPPRNLSAAEVQPGIVLLAWQHPVTYAARAYLGTRLFVNGNQYGDIIPATVNSLQIYLAGGEYSFALKAVYGSGESSPITCSLTVIGWMEPVSEILYNIADDDVILSWNPVQEPSALYLIHRDGVLIGQTTNSTYTDANLNNGSYQYHIIVQHPNGVSDPSPVLNVVLEVLYPPTDMQATVADNDVNLVWTAPASSGGLNRSLLGYRIWRNDAILTPNPISGTSYLDSDLINGSYSYQVAAVYSSGISAPCEAPQATIAVQYPPHSLNAQTLGGVITLSWAMDQPLQPDFISYRVYKDGSFLSETNSATYEDWGLAPGTYQYYVTAVYASGESLPTEPLSVELDYAFIPTIVTASVSGSSVSLHWAYVTPLPGIVITGYELWRNDQLLTTQNENDYLDENLDNGNYQYYVRVAYVHGTSVASNLLNVTVEVAYPPRELSGTVSGNEATLSWLHPVTGPREMLSYLVYRNDRQIASISDTIYHDIGLANGSHTYYVKAQYSSGVSPASNTITLDVEIPYPPQNLQAAVTADTVNLTWDTPATAPRALLSYNVYRNGIFIGQSTGQSYSDSGLANGSYEYYVTALYDSGESVPSNTVTAFVEVPNPPRNLSSSTDGTTANLLWELPLTGPRALLSYNVYRDGSFVGSSTELAFSESGLANGSYSYHVTALYSSGESPASNTTIAVIDYPYPPLNLQAAVTADTVDLTWDAPATAPRALLSYSIYRDGVLIGQTLSQSYSDSGLANGSYQYYVTALYDSGESISSNLVTAVVEVPYPPQNLSCSTEGTTANLVWELPLTGPRALLSYNIYRDGSFVGSSTELAFSESGLANGSYSYHVTALYSSGESPASNVTIATIDFPYPPQNLQAAVTADTVNLSWDTPATAPRALLSYNVYRNGIFIGQSLSQSYSDSGLANSSYDYYVTALYDSGESIPSNTVSAFVEVPYPPTQLSATVNEDSVLLSWSTPIYSPLRSFLGYFIYRNGILHQSISNPALTEWLDAGLANGSYSYYLIARYDAGLSMPSNTVDVIVNVMPDLFPPENLVLNLVGERSAHLSWSAPEGNPQFYRIYRNDVELRTTTATSYLDENLDNGTYDYHVKAQYPEGLSSASNTATLNLMVAYPPQSFDGSISSGNSVTLSWLAPDQGEIGYILRRNGAQLAIINDPQILTYMDGNLANGSYSYQIAAIYPDLISGFTDIFAISIEIIYPPRDFSLAAQGDFVDLTWNAPLDSGGLLAYRLYRNGSLLIEGTSLSHHDANLPNGNYEYQLGTLYSFGESALSEALPASVQIAYPAANLQASLQDDDILLSWDPVSDAGFFDTYKLFRDGEQIASTASATYSDTDLPNGSYSYHVIAAYSFGDADATDSVTMNLELLYPPTGLSCQVQDTDVTLSWTPPMNQGGLRSLLGYQINRNNQNYTTTTEPALLDADLDNGTYSYQVFALYDSGLSSGSSPVSVDILYPYSPSGFSILMQDSLSVRLDWIPPVQGETAFGIWRNEQQIAFLTDTTLNSYLDTDLPNGNHTYHIIAHYGDVASAPTEDLMLQILNAYPPQNLSCVMVGADVNLQWSAPDDTWGLEEYIVYQNSEELVRTSQTSFLISTVPNGEYSYMIKTRYGSTISEPSNECSLTVHNAHPVTNFTATLSDNVALLSWIQPWDLGGFEYIKVYRDGLLIGQPVNRVFTDTLSVNGDYTYQVCAHYSWADSEMSPSHTLHFVQNHIPQNFTAQVTGNDVSLSWIAPDDTTFLNGYRLYRNGVLLVQTTETSYTDPDRPNGMYTYRLHSLYDDQESSPNFAQVSIILPQSPQNVVAQVLYGNCVQINWDSLSMVYGFENYQLWRNGSLIHEGRIDSYIDVVPNGLYHYSVIAVYQDSVSEPSAEASLSVIVPQPLLEASYTIDANNVSFQWQAPEDTYGFTGVEIWRGASLVATVLPEAGNSYCDVNVGNGSHFYELRSVYGDHGYRPTSFRVMIVVPHSPGNFRGEVNGHLITLFWDPPADMYYMEGYRLIQGSQVINLGRDAVSYNVEALPNGSYEYSLQSVYEGPNLSLMQTISLNINQVYPVSSVTAFRMETAISIHWEAPQCLFAPSSYEIHLLPGGPDTPVGEWILLESDCQEIFYLDSEHGGIEHGYFAWAVTAKWDNTTGGIPVISNVVYLEEIPEYTWLIGNYPNPFNPHTKIRFWLKEYGPVSLVVYNARGQKVRTLVNESMTPGTHNVDFDGKDDAGRDLGSGVYFSLLKSGSYHRIRKMILSK